MQCTSPPEGIISTGCFGNSEWKILLSEWWCWNPCKCEHDYVVLCHDTAQFFESYQEIVGLSGKTD
jgi:hypothetical protein